MATPLGEMTTLLGEMTTPLGEMTTPLRANETTNSNKLNRLGIPTDGRLTTTNAAKELNQGQIQLAPVVQRMVSTIQ